MVISHARRKSKGSAAERVLIHRFWAVGWAAFRAAGSGSNHFPCPDLIAGNNFRKLAIEVKVTSDKKKYFPKDEINNLLFFSKKFGADPWVVIKFDRDNFYFISPEELVETPASFVASHELAKTKGLLFEELIENK